MFRWEWLVIEFLVLGWAITELIRTRRAIRRNREEEANRPQETMRRDG